MAGLLFDSAGRRLTPVHTQRHGRRYRYYVKNGSSQRLRLPAHELERLVLERLAPILFHSAPIETLSAFSGSGQSGPPPSTDPAISRAALLKFVQRIIVEPDQLWVHLVPLSTAEAAQRSLDTIDASAQHPEELQIAIPYVLQSCRGEVRLLGPDGRDAFARAPNQPLVKAIAQAFAWRRRILEEGLLICDVANEIGCTDRYVSQILRLAFLAPDIISGILEAREPADLTVKRLTSGMPFCWSEQRLRFGFQPV